MKNSRISTTRLAEICGVSQGTVDRALNNRKGINKETKEKILAVAKEYGYRPNIHARSIAGGNSMLIGIVVFDLHNQYFADILMELEACCQKLIYVKPHLGAAKYICSDRTAQCFLRIMSKD